MGFLRFLFITIAVLYIVRLVRIFLGSLFGNAVSNAQQQRGGQQYYQQQQRRPNFDSKVRIDHVPQPKKSQVPDSEGDFVDYEEVK